MRYFCARLILNNALGWGPLCLPMFQCHVFWSYFRHLLPLLILPVFLHNVACCMLLVNILKCMFLIKNLRENNIGKLYAAFNLPLRRASCLYAGLGP